MKKIVILLLVLVLAAGIVGCSNKDNTASSTNNASESNNKISEDNTSSKPSVDNKENKKGAEVKTINLGDKVSLPDFVDFTLEKVSWETDIKPSNTSGFYSHFVANDGETYFVIKGTIKNTSGAGYDVGDTLVKMKFNDKYEYNGRVEGEGDDGTDFYLFSLKPLKSTNIYLIASVPNEIKNTFEKCVVNFGFKDNFEYYSITPMDELPHQYQITINK